MSSPAQADDDEMEEEEEEEEEVKFVSVSHVSTLSALKENQEV